MLKSYLGAYLAFSQSEYTSTIPPPPPLSFTPSGCVQVAAVREGMSTMIPVPLLSLMTAQNLEQCVCGMEDIDIMMLKKVVRYISSTRCTWMYLSMYSCMSLKVVGGLKSYPRQQFFFHQNNRLGF